MRRSSHPLWECSLKSKHWIGWVSQRVDCINFNVSHIMMMIMINRNNDNNNEISMMIAATVYWMLNRSQARFPCDQFYESSQVACQKVRCRKAHRCFNNRKIKVKGTPIQMLQDTGVEHLTANAVGHEPPIFISQHSFLPIPHYFTSSFQIWDWPIPIINIVTVGFRELGIPLRESHTPWAVHWVCRIRIFPPTPSVSWRSEFLFDGKIFCISFHILYPCIYTHGKKLKSTLQHNSVFSWGNYHD